MIMFWLSFLACEPADPNLKTKVEGTFEVVQVVTTAGEVDGETAVLNRYPGCQWGRQVMQFKSDQLLMEVNLVCPNGPRPAENIVCEARAVAPATFDDQSGWQVQETVRVATKARGVVANGDPALLEEISCELTLQKGLYELVEAPRQKAWDAAVRLPSGVVYQLNLADVESDYATIFRDIEKRMNRSTPAAAPAPAAEEGAP